MRQSVVVCGLLMHSSYDGETDKRIGNQCSRSNRKVLSSRLEMRKVEESIG